MNLPLDRSAIANEREENTRVALAAVRNLARLLDEAAVAITEVAGEYDLALVTLDSFGVIRPDLTQLGSHIVVPRALANAGHLHVIRCGPEKATAESIVADAFPAACLAPPQGCA